MRFLSVLLLCLCASVALADQLYKWTDSEGHVHYSQTPPPGTAVKAQSVQVQKPQEYSTAPSPDEQKALQQEAAQAQADQRKATFQARQKANLEQVCQNVRSQLQAFEQSGRAFTVDAAGNRQPVAGPDRDKTEQQLKDQVVKACGGF